MSNEKLQSVQPPVEAPQCGFEGSVCIEPEYYYEDENGVGICNNIEGDVVGEYEKLPEPDKKKALHNRAKSFKEKRGVKPKGTGTDDSDELASSSPSAKNKKSLLENVASAAAPQNAAVFVTPSDATQQTAAVARADSIRLAPTDLGGLLCFDREPSRPEARHFVSDPDRIVEGDPAFDISSLVPLSAVLFTQDPSLNLPAAMAVLMHSKGSEEFFGGSNSLPPIVPAESTHVVFKEGAAQHVAEKTAPRESDSALPVSYSSSLVSYFDFALPVANIPHRISAADSPRQGGVFLFFATGGVGYDAVPALLILHPSIVNPRSVAGSRNLVFDNGGKSLYSKVSRGSDSQGSRDSGQQGGKGSGGESRRQRQRG